MFDLRGVLGGRYTHSVPIFAPVRAMFIPDLLQGSAVRACHAGTGNRGQLSETSL